MIDETDPNRELIAFECTHCPRKHRRQRRSSDPAKAELVRHWCGDCYGAATGFQPDAVEAPKYFDAKGREMAVS